MTRQRQFPDFSSDESDRERSPVDLVMQFKAGDSQAASRLHEIYAQRVLALVRARINPAFNRRMDAEDVVQSAFRSFFRIVSTESWTADGRTEQVWSLLCAIAFNKLNAKLRFHSAGKRDVNQEIFDIEDLAAIDHQQAETLFVDELESLMRELTEHHQQILELLLNGVSEVEVAETKQCSLRTIYRVLERTVDQLQSRLNE